MAYKRVISYFDFIEDEKKRGNAGFVKWERYDECHILSVFVNGLEDSFQCDAKVFLDEKMLGTLSVRGGRAEGTYLLTAEDRDEIGCIRVVPDNRRVLVAEFETCRNDEKQKDPVVQCEEELESNKAIPGLWEKLGQLREVFKPFNDGTECYRILLKDLNLLENKYRPLSNNQFLMHGYYNYRHLIIYKKSEDASEYWLGVPGIYHEREKMAARMFGFEKFEAANRDYRAGDLGYYLVTVK